jgi:hypothetical protein
VIPERRRAVLPPGHWYLVHQSNRGHLVVTVSALVPPGSRLEQEVVREAVRAWRRHQRRGLVLLPAPIAGGAGLGWLARQFRRPTMAAGATVTAAGMAWGAVTLLPSHTPHRPPAAEAALAPPTAPAPRHHTVPHRPAKPAPQRPGPARPQVSQPHAVAAVSTTRVSVHPARLPVRLPVHVPPVHWTPPRLPKPPVKVPLVSSPVTATDCRLVRLELKVVRVCL